MRAIPILRAFLVILLSSVTFLLCNTPAGAMARPAKAYQFTVDTTLDRHDANWDDNVCADQQGQCSLRAAIESADFLPDGSTVTIVVPAGTYQLVKGTLRLAAHRTITITGASSKTTIIKGNQTFRIMSIGYLIVRLSQLTIEGGKAVGGNNGGGIENFGTLTVSNSTISGNSTGVSGGGGGIYNESGGMLTISNSIISNNSAGSSGGGGLSGFGEESISNSTISGNSTMQTGGGIENWATVTVSNSTISNNTALDGGGIGSFGNVSVSNSTISNNTATSEGGGIEGSLDIVSVSNSTISNNTAFEGGAIFISGFTLTVSNSTISGNSAIGSGGGLSINTGAMASISNSTISSNSAPGGGSNIINNHIPPALTGTIVSNGTGSPNCSGIITDMGDNLDSDGSCDFTLSSDLNKVDPLLGPLHNNGGPTQTMALLQGSPAIDWVNTSADCPATDQRGDVRPDNGESACDIGAYESAY